MPPSLEESRARDAGAGARSQDTGVEWGTGVEWAGAEGGGDVDGRVPASFALHCKVSRARGDAWSSALLAGELKLACATDGLLSKNAATLLSSSHSCMRANACA